jgi:hypothetical protein
LKKRQSASVTSRPAHPAQRHAGFATLRRSARMFLRFFCSSVARNSSKSR